MPKLKQIAATGLIFGLILFALSTAPAEMPSTSKAKPLVWAINAFTDMLIDTLGRTPAMIAVAALGLAAIAAQIPWPRRERSPDREWTRADDYDEPLPDETVPDEDVPIQRRRSLQAISESAQMQPTEAKAAVMPLPSQVLALVGAGATDSEDEVYEIASADFRELHGPDAKLPRDMFTEPRKFHGTLSVADRLATEYLMAANQFADDLSFEALQHSFHQLQGPEAGLRPFYAVHAVNLIHDANRRLVLPAERPRPLVLARKPREPDRDWSGERSHLGGLPRLGEADWPRGKDGRPLPFVAQIDLAEVAAACPESPLPHEGSLAFFVNSGAVLYVPPGFDVPATAPDDLPMAYDEGGYPFPEEPSSMARPTFPF